MFEINLTIIIPVYNAARYLRKTIDSILNQLRNDVEIIFVDDGSKDNSLEILKEYGEKNENIHIYHQENLGAPAARNFGLAYAKGEYVLFFDSDDLIEPKSIEYCLNRIKSKDTDLLIGEYDQLLLHFHQ
jgi:glycosyltransferase involved in cell wall biosynthesis